MKLLALPVLLLALGASDPEPVLPPVVSDTPLMAPAEDCEEEVLHLAEKEETVRPQRLGDLPPASMELAVWATKEGCTVPQVVMEQVGR